MEDDTHMAYLWNVQPISKTECEHPISKLRFPIVGLKEALDRQNDTEEQSIENMRLVCECGAHLKAKWEVAD